MPNNFDSSSNAGSSHGPGNKPKYNRTLSASSVLSYTRVSPSAGNPVAKLKFPRIDECAHFHYETVECGKVTMKLLDEPPDGARLNGNTDPGKPEPAFWIEICCKRNEWVIRRVSEQFKTLDELLHECVYDRRFTHLPSLRLMDKIEDVEKTHEKLRKYMVRLSELPEDQMSCAPVLHWLEMDNKGRNLVAALRETADINIPAVAAAHAIRRYTSQSADELSLEVGDMVSIIDMTDSNWWRGKCRLRVGSFPSQCVKRINDAKQVDEAVPPTLPSSPTSASPPSGITFPKNKPILKKHGKFMDFLRSFLVTRPTKSRLKQSGILKERVFGCDLGEYLHNSGDDVPIVVTDCTAFVEKFGIVDGIYRISGVSSHVQNLRHEYDCERRPNLNRDPGGKGEQSFCDPHSVAGLCKLYFRELPNPLLTYQLYNRFAEAINAPEDDRLLKIHDVIQQLPPPHYRTLKHLALHLQNMAQQNSKTSMHCRNLAIVWAPNLLRSRDLEAGLAAFTEARVQSVVTEFLISNADVLFSEKLQNIQYDTSRGQKPPRPKSLMVLSAPKLISLEEAQARSKAGGIISTSNSTRHDFGTEHLNQSNVSDIYRRKSSSPPSTSNSQTSSSSPPRSSGSVVITAGIHSVFNKRRQSMDPKLTRPHFPSNSRHYASQHSGWRSKIGSFLKKGPPPAIETSNKPRAKVVLRRSQSDDSMLSPHNSRQDINKIGSVKSRITDDKLMMGEPESSIRPSLRQIHSPRRSPRPRGRIFNAFDDNFTVGTSPPAMQKNNRQGGMKTDSLENGSHTPVSPVSLPLPSLDSSANSSYSNMPVIMGESGLDFDPLHFGPSPSETDTQKTPESVRSIKSKDRKKEDVIIDKEKKDYHPSNVQERDESENVNISTGKDELDANSKTEEEPLSKKKVDTKTSELNSKYEDILNANVQLMIKHESDFIEDIAEKTDSVRIHTDVIVPVNGGSIACTKNHENNNNNNRKCSTKENSDPNLLKTDAVPDPPPTSTNSSKMNKVRNKERQNEKVEVVDMADTGMLSFEHRDKNRAPGVHKTAAVSTKSRTRPVNLPVTGDYSIHYICNSQRSNGRTRRSITAAFVQDRTRNPGSQPHSIVRSMDVPPTVHVSRSAQKHHSHHPRHQVTHSPMSKRQRALMAVASLRQQDSIADSRRLHHRSLSAGDELDFRKMSKQSNPVPLPRNLSNASSNRPIPQPRRRLFAGGEKERQGPPKDRYNVSAPSTPSDGLPNLDSNFSSDKQNLLSELDSGPLQVFEEENETINHGDRPAQEKLREHTNSKGIHHSKHRQLTKAHSSSGIVSPSDNICASTGLSWV